MGVIKFVLGLLGMLLMFGALLVMGAFFWVLSDTFARYIVASTVDLISRSFG